MKLNVVTLASIFRAMSDETRLRILYLLKKRPLCVCEIMGALDITQTKTSRHLIYLKNAGLLDASKEDRWMVYRIRDDLLKELRKLVDETVELLEKTGELTDIERRLDTILKNESLYRQTFGISGRNKGNAPKVLEPTPDM